MVSQLTEYQKRRFRKSCKCINCGRVIYDNEEMNFIKNRIGHYTVYEFYHERCDMSGKEVNECKRSRQGIRVGRC